MRLEKGVLVKFGTPFVFLKLEIPADGGWCSF